jgi:hypothetical protein
MSTIWGGLCLSHNPVIEFDLANGQYECKNSLTARASLRENKAHEHCAVMLGGYSYPLVVVACPCARHREPKEWNTEDLRIVLAAARAGVELEVQEWLHRNNCWTLDKLAKVVGTRYPECNESKDERTQGS